MNSLAIFVHYSRNGKTCPNAMLYARELRRFFSNVIISSNIHIDIEEDGITALQFEKNAYDFGYFYQALNAVNAYENYDTIGFFNDSNYIINPLDGVLRWKNEFEYYGITDSHERRPDVFEDDQYHIQSHFLIFRGKAIKLLHTFFSNIRFEDNFDFVGDREKLRAGIIIQCEIKLTRYMLDHGVRCGSYFKANEFVPMVSGFNVAINMHTLLWKQLIVKGYPFIKKKIIDHGFTKADLISLKTKTGMESMETAPTVIREFGDSDFIKTILV